MARKIVLMYHSVHTPARPAVLGAFPFPFARFCWQLEAARAAGWRFGRMSQVREPVDVDTLYVTSDDGTRDWAELVLPWCEQRGIPTHVGVITGPWLDEPVYPMTHMVQLLLKTRSEIELKHLAHRVRAALTDDQLAYVHRIYSYEAMPYRRIIKGAFNLVFDQARAERLLGELTIDEQRRLADRFAKPEHYRPYEMVELGVHTVTHTAMGLDVETYMRDEVDRCAEHLQDHGLSHGNYFTLPMAPRYGATADDLIVPLKRRGYTGMIHTQNPWDGRSFIVSRTDAKHVEAMLGLPTWDESQHAVGLSEVQRVG
ncbi:hypothetical protein ACERK3_09110 [Phycisphaerales bacterium AB-hyl4]|uniref:Polysaccharide deacetylase n=1 Tax=Natronomicrosphaera hydrolytica TaxID=3242702 RepID=A0ABV4U6H6_9BACT